MNFLSIDFDFFIDTDINTRNNIFPYAEDATPEIVHSLWENVYSNHPEVSKISVLPAYYYSMDEYLSCQDFHADFYAEAYSHKEIFNFLDKHISADTSEIKLVNIDFHHDNYCMYGGTLTCANWLRKIVEKYPDKKWDITWVKRPDSEEVSLEGNFPYKSTTALEDVLNIKYDGIFLCLSPEWTPPHLIKEYNHLKNHLMI